MALLEINDLHAGYGPTSVLHGMSLSVGPGELRVVLGANGAGKSTLIKSILGIVPAKSGTIRLDEKVDLVGLPPHRVSEAGVAWVPEGRGIFATLSVTDNLLLGAFSMRGSANRKSALEAEYERFPILAARRNQTAGSLSGGEQQMLAISRALMPKPRLVIMDEPSLGLAPKIVSDMFRIIQELNQAGLGILLVEQNARQAINIADWVYVMERGKITAEGSSEDMKANEDVQKAYLGG